MFEQLFERSGDPIWILDPQTGVFIDCNAATVTLMRCRSKAQLLQARPADLSPTCQPGGRSSQDMAAEVVARAEQSGGHRFEWVARRFDGTEVTLEVRVTPVHTGGRTLHVVVSRDISERKRLEEELRQLNATLERRISERTAQLSASEARARILVEHAPEAIVVLDGDTGRFLSCNENATQLYGLDRDQLLRRTAPDVSPARQPDGRESTVAAQEWIRQALEGETPVFDWMHRHTSGRLIPCEIRLVRLPAADRQLVRASITDNTRRHRREQIQQATYQISEAVHTAVDLPSLYARIHQIIKGLMSAENFYLAVLEPDQETFSFPYFVDEFDRSPAPMQVSQGLTGYVLRTGRPLVASDHNIQRDQPHRQAVVRDDGMELRYTEMGTPAAVWLGVPLSTQGRPFGVMAVQDYHSREAYGEEDKQILMFVAEQTALAIEHKRAEAELLRSLAREKELSQLKSSFVSMVSHEFRTPLGIIMSSAEILEDYLDHLDPAERKQHLQSIHKNTRRMAALMEEVLLLSRVEAGKMDFQPTRLDLRTLGQRIADEVLSATDRKCPVHLAVAGVPNAAWADERLLRHIFTNLLSNAIKYSDPGSPVRFVLRQNGPEAVCEVSDSGIGIPPQDIPHLFQAFHRGSNAGQQPGSGLGLVIVKRCVELHGGRVALVSRPGQGTTFTVRLPLFPDYDPGPLTPAQPSPSPPIPQEP